MIDGRLYHQDLKVELEKVQDSGNITKWCMDHICIKGEEWMRSVETAAASREDVRLSNPDFLEISL